MINYDPKQDPAYILYTEIYRTILVLQISGTESATLKELLELMTTVRGSIGRFGSRDEGLRLTDLQHRYIAISKRALPQGRPEVPDNAYATKLRDKKVLYDTVTDDDGKTSEELELELTDAVLHLTRLQAQESDDRPYRHHETLAAINLVKDFTERLNALENRKLKALVLD